MTSTPGFLCGPNCSDSVCSANRCPTYRAPGQVIAPRAPDYVKVEIDCSWDDLPLSCDFDWDATNEEAELVKVWTLARDREITQLIKDAPLDSIQRACTAWVVCKLEEEKHNREMCHA